MRVLICVLVCAGLGLAAHAATVEVTSPPRAVEPGDLALHVFRVANPEDAALEIRLSVDLPQGWSALPVSPRITLEPGETDTVFVTVQVPRGAEAGDYEVRLAASWNGEEASATAEVSVRQVAAVAVESPQGKDASPGDLVSYTFVVINRGNTVDRYTVNADSARGHRVTVSPGELPLAPSERGTVVVEVVVPATASAGRDRLRIVIQSTTAPAVTQEAFLFTTVLPPDPELIVGHTRAEVDAKLAGRLDYDLLNDHRASGLEFSGRTFLLDGDLSFTLRTTRPVGGASISLDRARLSYTRDEVRLRAGEYTMSLPHLHSLTASGVLVDLFPPFGSLSLLSGWRDGEGRFGGAVTLVGNAWELGTAYRETRGKEEHVRALAGWMTHTLGEHVEFELASSLALGPELWDEGLQAALRVEVEPLVLLNLSWHSVGGGIPNPLSDQRGISMSGRLSAPPLSFRYSSRWIRHRPLGIHGSDTPSRVELSSSLDWAPEEWPMSFFGRFSGRREWDGAAQETERVQETELGLTGGEAPLTFRLSGTLRKSQELPNQHTLLHTTYRQRFTLSGEFVETTLSLKQKALFDDDGEAVERGWGAALTTHFTDTPHQISLHWEHEGSEAALELEWEGELTDDFSAAFTVGAGWNDQGEVNSLRAGVSFEYSFGWVPPFLPARGWLEGHVLADEQPVEGAVLATNGHEVATDEDGRFLFPPLEPGRYAVTAERLPQRVRLLDPEPMEAIVELDRRTQLAVHCERLAEVRGVVFEDIEQEGDRHPDDPGLQGVTVVLMEDEQPVERITTDTAGRFSFTLLSPAEYTVRLDENTLPQRYEPTTPSELNVELQPGAVSEVEFGAWQRPREVVIAPTPPLADFDWEPAVPEAGEEVSFDAQLSMAGDAEIVTYRWDLTDDGETDKTGRAVAWVFSEPGVYRITLTVEDELELEDELTMPIEVVPAD
ncbi:MAG: SdrD B-like domain-containing protein [Candidatus Bipolaricaulota bacterium]